MCYRSWEKKVPIWRSRQNSLGNVRTIKEEIHYKSKGVWAILTKKNLYKVTESWKNKMCMRGRWFGIAGAQNTCKERGKVKLAMEPDHKKLFCQANKSDYFS